jgi:ABC-2 type transport system permease protein
VISWTLIQEVITVTLQEQGVLPGDLANLPQLQSLDPLRAIASFIRKTLAIAELEARKIRHDATDLVTRAVQPVLWLLVFGQVFTQNRAIPTGNVPYIDFLTPGILAQSVLFVSIFYGIAVIWERDLGILHKFLVSPTPRAALVLGKALSASIRALSQVAIIYLVALILGVKLSPNPFNVVGVLLVTVLGAMFFSTLSLIIASLMKTRERFMGIGQVITMPLFFTSNAIYPMAIMPAWLLVLAHINPLSYEVDALRALMLANGSSVLGLGLDFAVLILAVVVVILIEAKLYPRVTQ